MLFLSYKTEWPGDLGNLCSSNDPATKFCISLGKSLHFSEVDFLFSFFICLTQLIQAVFPFNSVCFRTHNTGVNIHICTLHSLSSRESYKSFVQSDTTPLLYQPSSCTPVKWNWIHRSQHSFFFMHTSICVHTYIYINIQIYTRIYKPVF